MSKQSFHFQQATIINHFFSLTNWLYLEFIVVLRFDGFFESLWNADGSTTYCNMVRCCCFQRIHLCDGGILRLKLDRKKTRIIHDWTEATLNQKIRNRFSLTLENIKIKIIKKNACHGTLIMINKLSSPLAAAFYLIWYESSTKLSNYQDSIYIYIYLRNFLYTPY